MHPRTPDTIQWLTTNSVVFRSVQRTSRSALLSPVAFCDEREQADCLRLTQPSRSQRIGTMVRDISNRARRTQNHRVPGHPGSHAPPYAPASRPSRLRHPTGGGVSRVQVAVDHTRRVRIFRAVPEENLVAVPELDPLGLVAVAAFVGQEEGLDAGERLDEPDGFDVERFTGLTLGESLAVLSPVVEPWREAPSAFAA